MFIEKITPRFCETDALGHINNIAYLSWFEGARNSIFKIFVPDLNIAKWNMILAHMEIDYLAQGEYQFEVEVKTRIEKIGNSSLNVIHEAHQQGKIIAKCSLVMIHFNYETNKSAPIPDDIRAKLQEHL